MSSKSEIGTYIILGLVVVNIILTIYCHSRSQEDYRRNDSLPATPAPTQAQTVKVSTMAPAAVAAAQAEAIKLANMNKNVGSSILPGSR
jgi:hypothetical protein